MSNTSSTFNNFRYSKQILLCLKKAPVYTGLKLTAPITFGAAWAFMSWLAGRFRGVLFPIDILNTLHYSLNSAYILYRYCTFGFQSAIH